MEKFTSELDLLFIPIKSKIYTSEKFPHILYDEAALSVKDRVPDNIKNIGKLVQYTYLSGAVRARRIDEKVSEFLRMNPNGIVIELGCRLSTACYRLKVKNKWYCVDCARNIKIREQLFKPQENVINIKSDIYKYLWLNDILKENSDVPILVVCIGSFYYYQKTTVEAFLNHLFKIPKLEIIFDAVNSLGLKRMKKYYKHWNIKDEHSIFCINDIEDLQLANSIVIDHSVFFEKINKKDISLITRIYMKIADKFKMIRIYHIANK